MKRALAFVFGRRQNLRQNKNDVHITVGMSVDPNGHARHRDSRLLQNVYLATLLKPYTLPSSSRNSSQEAAAESTDTADPKRLAEPAGSEDTAAAAADSIRARGSPEGPSRVRHCK